MDLIIQLLEWLTPHGIYSYYIMFGILIACGFGLPLPEDVVLVTGGLLASRGIVSVELTLLVTMVGVLLGDSIVYFLGWKMGADIKKTKLFKRILTKSTDEKIEHIFDKFGDKVIFAARFMPGLRMPLFMSAGIYKVPTWKFLLLDGFAAIISVPVWIYVGFIFGKNLETLEERISQATWGIYGVLLTAALIGVGVYLIKKKIKEKANKIAG